MAGKSNYEWALAAGYSAKVSKIMCEVVNDSQISIHALVNALREPIRMDLPGSSSSLLKKELK